MSNKSEQMAQENWELMLEDWHLEENRQLAQHAARVAAEDVLQGHPGRYRDVSNRPAWRHGYDAGLRAHKAV